MDRPAMGIRWRCRDAVAPGVGRPARRPKTGGKASGELDNDTSETVVASVPVATIDADRRAGQNHSGDADR